MERTGIDPRVAARRPEDTEAAAAAAGVPKASEAAQPPQLNQWSGGESTRPARRAGAGEASERIEAAKRQQINP